MARPDLYNFVVPGTVLDAWDRVPWNDFPGEPTVYVPSEATWGSPVVEARQYKYIFDAMYEANLNVTNTPGEGDKELMTVVPGYLRLKTELTKHLKELGIPTLTEVPFDPTTIRDINYPCLLKPTQGKNSFDVAMPIAYKTFPNGNALLAALRASNHNKADEIITKQYFIQESAAQQNGQVEKILAFVLINGNKEVRVVHVDEQTWTPRVRSTNLDLAIRRPEVTVHNAVCEDIAQKFANYFHDMPIEPLKNCCLYIQCIIKDGVYYYTDADVCIPKVYARALRHHLSEHLRFMFDAATDVTIPSEYVVTRTLTSLRGAKETHRDLLESRVDQYEGFYWIQRFNYNPAEEVGRYMLITSGATEVEALEKMTNWVEYLTVE